MKHKVVLVCAEILKDKVHDSEDIFEKIIQMFIKNRKPQS